MSAAVSVSSATHPDGGIGARGSARLFLALCPTAVVQAALAEHAGRWQWNVGAARYVPSDWHVTLHFLGAVPRARLEALQQALDVPMTPFELRFGEPVLWPHGLAVLLPEATPAALQRLYDALGQRLRELGLRTEERPYKPHFTLARHAGGARPPVQWPSWSWPVQDYALVESTGDATQRYRVLRTYGRSDAALP